MIDSSLLVLDDLFDTLPSGLIIYKSDGAIVRMNYKAREILGLPDGHTPGLDHWPYYLSPLATVLKTADSDINRSEISLSLPIRDEESTIGFSVKLIPTPDGQTLRTLTFTDITQVMKDRLAFDKIKDELNQSKKLASIGTMIAGVAHEMNNPLTGISMSSSLLKMNLDRLKALPSLQQQEPKVLESLEKALSEVSKIIRATDKAAFLVSDLLAYSKPSQVVMVPVPLHGMMTDFVGALKSHPQFAQLTFNLVGATDRVVQCDRIKLEQVFFNLCKNACDATEGRGSLEVFYSEHEEGGKPFIVTHVKDNGPGIDKTVISRIFDPFFTTKGHSGVGLGLSISYRTVEQHGGLLSVESAKWEGSEFKVSLPVYTEEAAP